jgi:hypothetical protein
MSTSARRRLMRDFKVCRCHILPGVYGEIAKLVSHLIADTVFAFDKQLCVKGLGLAFLRKALVLYVPQGPPLSVILPLPLIIWLL